MISVCMATYNGARWISEQIESILIQLKPTDELIICDDGSTDNTLDIIRSFKDSRIQLYTFPHRVGPSKNFERTLNLSKGDFIFLADQDDIWLEGKVEKVVNALQQSILVMHDAVLINQENTILSNSYFKTRNVASGLLRNVLVNGYTGAFIGFRRELLRKALPIPMNINHDQWIALIAEIYGTCGMISEPLVKWRRHENTVTSLTHKSLKSYLQMIPDRVRIIWYLVRRLF